MSFFKPHFKPTCFKLANSYNSFTGANSPTELNYEHYKPKPQAEKGKGLLRP